MKISITHTIERETGGDVKQIELEITGTFWRGELEDYAFTPAATLTPEEKAGIEEKLDDARFDEFDEAKTDTARDYA